MGQGEKAQRRDSRGIKEGERPKILMDSPEDADIFHGEDLKVLSLAHWQTVPQSLLYLYEPPLIT